MKIEKYAELFSFFYVHIFAFFKPAIISNIISFRSMLQLWERNKVEVWNIDFIILYLYKPQFLEAVEKQFKLWQSLNNISRSL